MLPAPREAAAAAAKKREPLNNSVGKVNYFQKIERWIMDTGSGVDICSFADVPASRKGLQKSNIEVVFNTANGPIDSGPLYPGIVGPLQEGAAPFVLPDTPALLSVGKRCMEKG